MYSELKLAVFKTFSNDLFRMCNSENIGDIDVTRGRCIDVRVIVPYWIRSFTI